MSVLMYPSSARHKCSYDELSLLLALLVSSSEGSLAGAPLLPLVLMDWRTERVSAISARRSSTSASTSCMYMDAHTQAHTHRSHTTYTERAFLLHINER